MTISSPRQRVQSGRSPVWFEKSIEVVGDEEMDDVEELMVVDGVKEIDLVMDRGVLVVTSMIDHEVIPMSQDILRHARVKTGLFQTV